jgi:anti-anti-sigma factor
VLDLGGVDYIASIGLRVLMLASRQARAQGGTVVIAALQPLVREIFEISKFTLVFSCFPTVADALADLVAGAQPGAGNR